MASPRICSIDGCGNVHYGRGWCSKHYQQWRINGNPLAAKPPGSMLHAWIKDHKDYKDNGCLEWPYGKFQNGRPQIWVKNTNINAARVMCEVVHGPAPSSRHQAAHSCGQKWCMHPQHISWKTPSENELDKIDHGTIRRGPKNNKTKLTEEEIREIRSMKGKLTQREIAKRFGITQPNVGYIHRNESWSWLKE